MRSKVQKSPGLWDVLRGHGTRVLEMFAALELSL